MKIGIFDSGLGGLYTMKGIVKKLPQYDYVYLGDTKRLPYGKRSSAVIYEFLRESIEFLFAKQCIIVIVACNTASAEALRQLQQEYLPKKFPDRKVLGVIIPTVEICVGANRVGIIATNTTVTSGVYEYYFKKLSPKTKVISHPAPLLVPLIENNGRKWIAPILKEYIDFFSNKKIDTLILGCTHYPIIKKEIRALLPKNIRIIAQNETIPPELANYLKQHSEIEKKLSKRGKYTFFVTDITEHFKKQAREWFGKELQLQKVEISK